MATIAYGIEVLENARLTLSILKEQVSLGNMGPVMAKNISETTMISVERQLKDVYDSYTDAKDDKDLADLKSIVYTEYNDLVEFANNQVVQHLSKRKQPSSEEHELL